MNLFLKINKNLLKYKRISQEDHKILKTFKNVMFNIRFISSFGINLGGNLHFLQLTTSSIVFGIRTKNLIIDLNKSGIELMNICQKIEDLGYRRCVLYFVNSILSFRVSMKNLYDRYNAHAFSPCGADVNLLEGLVMQYAKVKKRDKKKRYLFKKFMKRKKNFLRSSGEFLSRKVFVASKWRFGFVSSHGAFLIFTDNVLRGKVQAGRLLSDCEESLNIFMDFFPSVPNYGFIGDQRNNFWITNEFRCAGVPNVCVVDNFTNKALLSMYGIPGNACSVDTSLFFLMLLISSYLAGYYGFIIKFTLHSFYRNYSFISTLNKPIFFRNFRKMKYLL